MLAYEREFFSDLAVEITQLGINRSQRRHRVPFAQREHVLPASGRIFDVQAHEAAVEERDQRDDRREGAARVESLIDRVAALLQGEQTNVGILDGQQLQNALTQGVIFVAEEFRGSVVHAGRWCMQDFSWSP